MAPWCQSMAAGEHHEGASTSAGAGSSLRPHAGPASKWIRPMRRTPDAHAVSWR
jgi:hypothetical protein